MHLKHFEQIYLPEISVEINFAENLTIITASKTNYSTINDN